MSGIYIKGRKPPNSCDDCWVSDCPNDEHIDGYRMMGRPTYCPLIPVPDHGRRVVYRGDVYNAIEAKRIKTLEHALSDRYIDGMHDGLKQALFALATVEDAPTIIPTSEEVYDKYTDTAGNLHWTGTQTGHHIIPADKEGGE